MAKKRLGVRKPALVNKKPAAGFNLKEQMHEVQVGVGSDNVFVYDELLTVDAFASKLNKPVGEVIKWFFKKGIALTLNNVLSEEQMGEICLDYGLDFRKEARIDATNVLDHLTFDNHPDSLQKRPPIVTVMGHVDHGKTTLLDYIKQSNVAAQESGGITQHIGAYQVEYKGEKITFIDTPGHEAFSEMRMQGANLTDFVVLVVAADDGVKAQTIEAINHTKAAKGVKTIVFVNKVDKPGALNKVDQLKAQLTDNGVLLEEFAGEVPLIMGSALTGAGVEELLDMIRLLAEVDNLQANYQQPAFGTVIEAHLDKGYGPVATLIVQMGVLKQGDYVILGNAYGKIRVMKIPREEVIPAAFPSDPVLIAGINVVPKVGSKFLVTVDEKSARTIASQIEQKIYKEKLHNFPLQMSKKNGEKEVCIILKTDVYGSLQAIKVMLNKLVVNGAELVIVHSGVGAINESDLQLAKVSRARVFGFNVKTDSLIKVLAREFMVDVYFHTVIYDLYQCVEKLLYGALDLITKEVVIGAAVVREIWRHSVIGTIAGCKLNTGRITRNSLVRVIREGVVISSSKVNSLRQGKENVNEVSGQNEFGVTISNFADFKAGDLVELYELVSESQVPLELLETPIKGGKPITLEKVKTR